MMRSPGGVWTTELSEDRSRIGGSSGNAGWPPSQAVLLTGLALPVYLVGLLQGRVGPSCGRLQSWGPWQPTLMLFLAFGILRMRWGWMWLGASKNKKSTSVPKAYSTWVQIIQQSTRVHLSSLPIWWKSDPHLKIDVVVVF